MSSLPGDTPYLARCLRGDIMNGVKQSATFDSSFWINAHRAGLLPYVLHRYELRYPRAVAAEMKETFPSGQEFWRLVRERAPAEAEPDRQQMQESGPGERAVIDLALQHRDWVLLVDDLRPLERATDMGLRVLCTPVLAVALYGSGKLNASETLLTLARLAAMRTVSPKLLAAARAQLGKSFAQPGDA